ncbi:MAG: hypothetical protein PVF27_07220 [Gemmatimonadales bacterium]|jgi:hypothetical protein
MIRANLALSLVLALGLTACDSLPFIGGGDDEEAAGEPTQTATQPPPDTTQVTQPEPEPAPPRRQMPQRPLTDEPWTPVDTGTVQPGMTRMEVIAVWGPPVAERVAGSFTYLYFRNGCEVTCGTFDVVFLENGQVVDAVVRGEGHTYAGMSSSPPDRQAEPTLPEGGQGDE